MDALERADLIRSQLRDSSACADCGSPDPARIVGLVCSDCSDFPRCWNCGRWIGDGSGWLPGYVVAMSADGEDVKVCTVCWETPE